MNRIKGYFAEELNKYKFFSLLIFIAIITLLAWQSDDAYHAYIMAKNLVEGNGFVYNIGERATASSCPLFTLVVAAGYFVIRDMFFVSLLICIVFSALAYNICVSTFCKTKKQVAITFVALVGSVSFISYTTSGLENSMLFFLGALFLKEYFKEEPFTKGRLLKIALLISLIAMTRMDAVLMFAPMAVYVYLKKRGSRIKFISSVGIGILGLLPFILWELFAVFYFGFFFPNTAYVKLGTNILLREYLVRGVKYYLNALLCDPVVLAVPLFGIVAAIIYKKAEYIWCMAGVALYCLYLLYIGGDFMMGRHFTVMFFLSVMYMMVVLNRQAPTYGTGSGIRKVYMGVVLACVIFTGTTQIITNQFLFGSTFSSPISDERAGYFRYASLFNNVISLAKDGQLCIRAAWNEQGIQEFRQAGYSGAILENIPGISHYYNADMYLNDRYALGDPFMSHLPAVKEENWRIGHMWREDPKGYANTILYGSNEIENPELHEYYEVIKLITRGDLFDSNRIKAIIDMNLGKYNYLVEAYTATLDENGRQQ